MLIKSCSFKEKKPGSKHYQLSPFSRELPFFARVQHYSAHQIRIPQSRHQSSRSSIIYAIWSGNFILVCSSSTAPKNFFSLAHLTREASNMTAIQREQETQITWAASLRTAFKIKHLHFSLWSRLYLYTALSIRKTRNYFRWEKPRSKMPISQLAILFFHAILGYGERLERYVSLIVFS